MILFYRDHIVEFCEDFFDGLKLTDKQKILLLRIQDNQLIKDRINDKSYGNTMACCLAALWYLTLYHQSKVIICGVTNFIVLSILKHEMSKWINCFLL